MRRLAPTLVAALTMIALAACGGGATPTPGGSSATAPSTPASSVAPPASGAVSSPAESGTAKACDTAPVDAVATVTVTIKDFAYAPEPVSAAVGDVITWKNDDSVPHSATLEDDSCGTAPIAPGASGSLVFSTAGTYTYKCIIHPAQMKGFTIEVK